MTTMDDSFIHVTYDVCEHCHFIYKQPPYHPTQAAEKHRYETHNNDPGNPGYRTYMERFVDLHVAPLQGVRTVLDYGSGPYPMLADVLRDNGYEVAIYDPYFHPHEDYADHAYDLIVLHEVIEHMADPITALRHLMGMLKPTGRLIVRTQFRPLEMDAFLAWWYKRDETHVGFFDERTFAVMSSLLDLDMIASNHKDVVVLQRR